MITPQRMKGLRITGKVDTMRCVLVTLSKMAAMWCRASSVGAISLPFGSLGIPRNRYKLFFIVVVNVVATYGVLVLIEKGNIFLETFSLTKNYGF